MKAPETHTNYAQCKRVSLYYVLNAHVIVYNIILALTKKTCTFYCQNQSNRVLFIYAWAWIVSIVCYLRQAAAFTHSLTYILIIKCYGYLFVSHIHTCMGARIKSQPPHLTVAQYVCTWQQVVVYCQCRCDCVSLSTVRTTNYENSNKNNNIIDDNSNNDDDDSRVS